MAARAAAFGPGPCHCFSEIALVRVFLTVETDDTEAAIRGVFVGGGYILQSLGWLAVRWGGEITLAIGPPAAAIFFVLMLICRAGLSRVGVGFLVEELGVLLPTRMWDGVGSSKLCRYVCVASLRDVSCNCIYNTFLCDPFSFSNDGEHASRWCTLVATWRVVPQVISHVCGDTAFP